MTPARKKIYIAIILICFASTGAIIYFGFFSSPSPSGSGSTPVASDTDNTVPVASSSDAARSSTLGGSSDYLAPSVFPNDTRFDWSLLESSNFKSLTSVPDLDLGPVGRPNPFNP